MTRTASVAVAIVLLGGLVSGCAGADRQQIAGKTVVVTGASSGFGRGVALKLAGHRANVVLAARRTAVLEEVATEVRAAGGRALVATTDVAREGDLERLAQAAIAEFGRIDVWINNAGVGALGRFEDVPLEDHARVIDVNLRAVIAGSHIAMRQFRRQGHGTLINIASIAGIIPFPYYASYAASKSGVIGLGAALHQELRLDGTDTIRVSTISPFATDTPWWGHVGNYTGRATRIILLDDADKVVEAIVDATVDPQKELAVGFKTKAASLAHRLAPGWTENIAGGVIHRVQMEEAPPAPPSPGNVQQPMPTGTGVEGDMRELLRQDEQRRQ